MIIVPNLRVLASDTTRATATSLVCLLSLLLVFLAPPRLSRQWKMHTAPLDDDKVTSYYEPFYGHDVEHLALALSALRRRHDSVVFLAGDSSLDNKYWFSSWADAVNGYETVLEPPRMKRDVCYWINEQAEREGKRLGCLNAAVEATSLNDRAWGRLLPQDAFIRDHITEDDVLVVSVGGNDVALSPLLCTAVNLAVLVCCVPRPCLERGACASPPNVNALVDCGCCGCGVPGCVAGLWGWPPGCVSIARTSATRVHLRPVSSAVSMNINSRSTPSSRFRVPAGSDTSSTCSRIAWKTTFGDCARRENRNECSCAPSITPRSAPAGAGRTRRSL